MTTGFIRVGSQVARDVQNIIIIRLLAVTQGSQLYTSEDPAVKGWCLKRD
jgi:hypothetical protein